jgi:hypothetical protein
MNSERFLAIEKDEERARELQLAIEGKVGIHIIINMCTYVCIYICIYIYVCMYVHI